MKKIILIILIILLSLLSTTICYCEKVSNDLSDNVFRLHIIANSNSNYDQEIKLLLKKEIISYLNTTSYNFNNLDEYIDYTNNNISNIEEIIKKIFIQYNYNKNFKVSITKSFFPTKQYDNLHFPPGIYNCLKIEIGESLGNNWWCVLYPNLCVLNEKEKNIATLNLQSNIEYETYNLISSDISYKFKIIELYQTIKSKNFNL